MIIDEVDCAFCYDYLKMEILNATGLNPECHFLSNHESFKGAKHFAGYTGTTNHLTKVITKKYLGYDN